MAQEAAAGPAARKRSETARAFAEDGPRKTHVGGQALIEGVMMRGKFNWAVAVREPDGGMYVEEHDLASGRAKNGWMHWPVVRGCRAFVESLMLGYKALEIAAMHAFADEDEGSGDGSGSSAALSGADASATRRSAAQDPSDPSCAALLQSDDDLNGVQMVAPSSVLDAPDPDGDEEGSWTVASPSDGSPLGLGAGSGCFSWSHCSVLEARDVAFDYADHRALEGVSFSVRGFSKVAIVGMSGSGKSTLANLLGGFAEPSGGGFLASWEGEEPGAFDLASDAWRRQVVYIPQDPYIFHATLRDNIAFYRPDADGVAIEGAVEAMGLQELVRQLPQGLDTPIGEGARALSGGQAQRIALARAFLDPRRRILLFDEPTAHLDIETELELKERMLPLMEGRLVFFATHRLHWIHDMDAVVVMEEGRLVEFGAPDELLARGGALSRLAERTLGGAR